MIARVIALTFAALLIFANHLAAQAVTIAVPPDAAPQDVIVGGIGPGPGPGIGLIAIEPFGVSSPVKDAPYTADAMTETTQVLADGNRIEQRTSASVARDSSGRVRRQQDGLAFGGLVAKSQAPLVTISDPQGLHVTLDTERRVAYRIRIPAFPEGGPRVRTAGAVGFGSQFEVAVPPPVTGDPVAGRADFQFSIREERGGRAAQGGVVMRAAPGMFSLAGPPETESQVEQLESRDIEGVRAEGTRTTLTIPANAIGNQAPIAVVNERWYSPELQVIVMTRRSDPRFGETVYRLMNIVRAEPPADLFEIPADYRVEDQPLPSR